MRRIWVYFWFWHLLYVWSWTKLFWISFFSYHLTSSYGWLGGAKWLVLAKSYKPSTLSPFGLWNLIVGNISRSCLSVIMEAMLHVVAIPKNSFVPERTIQRTTQAIPGGHIEQAKNKLLFLKPPIFCFIVLQPSIYFFNLVYL